MQNDIGKFLFIASMYECVVSDSEMTDEELAQKMFEKYAERYVSAKSDNFYGASDMKIVLLKGCVLLNG